MTDPVSTSNAPDNTSGALVAGRSGSIRETVSRSLSTVHLPPDRAVLTTPAMIGLMERCIAAVESEVGDRGWQSSAVEVRHRLGLRTGEECIITATLEGATGAEHRWRVLLESPPERIVGEGVIVRVRVEPCRS